MKNIPEALAQARVFRAQEIGRSCQEDNHRQMRGSFAPEEALFGREFRNRLGITGVPRRVEGMRTLKMEFGGLRKVSGIREKA